MILMASAVAGTLSGTVADRDGQPLAGVSVYAYDERLAYEVATTDTFGVFEMEVPDGRWRVRAIPTQTNHVERFWPGVWSYCDATTVDDAALDFSLDVGGTLSGVVLDLDEQPIEGAQVVCAGQDTRTANIARAGRSDEGGAFRCMGLDSDADGSAYSVQAEVMGWPAQYLGGVYRETDQPEAVQVNVGGDTDIGEFVLLDGITVGGVIQGDEGPVPEANVHVYSYGQVVDLVAEQDGSFFAQGLPPGDVVAWASLDGYGLTYAPDNDLPTAVFSAEEGDHVQQDIALPVEGRITGTLVGDGDLSGVTLLAYNHNYTLALGSQAEADGSFAAGRLRPGTWHLYFYAAAEGYLDDFARDDALERMTFTVEEPGQVLDVTIPLRLGAAVEGVVRDDAGQPVYGATVRVEPLDVEEYRARSTRTERDGSYRIQGLVPGSHRVDVSLTPYCDSDPDVVTLWYPDTPNELDAELLDVEGGDLVQLDWVMPADSDHDDMSDAWEEANGLDVGRDDADEDPDQDGLTNLEEYWMGTDPFEQDVDPTRCGGCSGSPTVGVWLAGLLLLRRRD